MYVVIIDYIVIRTNILAYTVIRVWQTCFQLLCTICLEQVSAIHLISQQFQLVQTSSKNSSVCSSLISV